MRKLFTMTIILAVTVLITPLAFAQSSGNFSASIATTQCEVNNVTGALTGGLEDTLLETTIKTPGSSSTALLIRPSLVTGLFTKTKVDVNNTAATAVAGVQVRVLIDGKVVAPGEPVGEEAGPDDGWIYFDKRFQKLETNIFNVLSDCDPTEAVENCFIDLILSTLSAHSFDFVVGNVGVGEHTLTVEWRLEPSAATANEAACVGPGVLTVQQVKTFSTGGGIVINE